MMQVLYWKVQISLADQEIACFYKIQRRITILTQSYYWTKFWGKWNQPTVQTVFLWDPLLEDPGIDGNIKKVPQKNTVCVDWINTAQDHGLVGSCKYGNEPSGSIQDSEFD